MSFAGAVLLLLATLPNLTLAQVLAHMRAVNNGLSAAHIASTSTSTIDGETVEIRNDSQGLRSLSLQCNGAVCLGTYFDGTRVFSVDINGTMLPQTVTTDFARRGLRIAGSLGFLDPHFTASNDGRIEDGGWFQIDTKWYRRIFVVDSLSAAVAIYVEPATWLLYGEHILGTNSTTLFKDYRRVGKFFLPFEIWRNGELADRYETREIVTDPLVAPAGLMPRLSAGAAGAALDPANPSPVAQCTLAGIATPCLIDTGNSGMAMSLELSERLNLKPIGVFRVHGIGNYATGVVRTGPLQIGNAEFPEANYVVLSDIHRVGYDLILGADVLASMPVTIDYPRHLLLFGAPLPRPGAITIALQFQNFVPVVPVMLAGVPAILALDTGDESNINLSNPYYTAHPTLFTPTDKENVSGVGGSDVEEIGRIANMHLGDLTLSDQVIGWTRTLNATGDGHLGTRFLSNFTVVLNYPERKVELLPRQ